MDQPFDQRQHYLPEGYLKGFTAASNGFLHELRKQDMRLRRQHISKVCYSTNFYDITDEQILKHFSVNQRYLESSFAYEPLLPAVLKQIQDRKPYITRKQFEIIIEAYVSIKHRTPFYRKKIDEIQKEETFFDNVARNVKKDINWLLDLQPDFDFDEYVKQFKNAILQDEEFAKKNHHRSLIETSFNLNDPVREAITKILSMNLIVLEITNPNDYFLVSDNPGYSLQRNIVFNTNYGDFDMIHFLINSKQTLLLYSFNGLNYVRPLIRLKFIPIRPAIISKINIATYEMANEAVFCEDRKYLETFKSGLPSPVS